MAHTLCVPSWHGLIADFMITLSVYLLSRDGGGFYSLKAGPAVLTVGCWPMFDWGMHQLLSLACGKSVTKLDGCVCACAVQVL